MTPLPTVDVPQVGCPHQERLDPALVEPRERNILVGGQRAVRGDRERRCPGQDLDVREDGVQRGDDAGGPADGVRRKEGVGQRQRQAEHAARREAGRAGLEELARVEPVRQPRVGRPRPHDDDLEARRPAQELPRVGDHPRSGRRARRTAGLRLPPSHLHQHPVLLHDGDVRWRVERQLVLQPPDGPSQHQDSSRMRVLERRHVSQHLLLGSAARERQHVVLEDRPLGSRGDAGDSTVGRVGRGHEARVVPGREPPVDVAGRGTQPRHGDPDGNQEPQPGAPARAGPEQQYQHRPAPAGHRDREGLRAEVKGQRGRRSRRGEAGALDAVRTPEGAAGLDRPGRRPAKRRSQHDRRRQRGRQQHGELPIEGQVGPRESPSQPRLPRIPTTASGRSRGTATSRGCRRRVPPGRRRGARPAPAAVPTIHDVRAIR